MPRPPKEYQAFRDLTDRLLAVSHDTIARRMAEYREQADQNPHKRGPKPKKRRAMRPAVSRDSGA